jgi:MarR family 2-MHQ and catechol resistance regulon transcriptional repressor
MIAQGAMENDRAPGRAEWKIRYVLLNSNPVSVSSAIVRVLTINSLSINNVCMSTTLRNEQPAVDKRGKYYEERVRNSARFEEFHRPSVELLLNLIYTYDVVETRLTRVLGAHSLSLSGFNILMILNSMKPAGCQLHELGELLLVSRANVTGLVDSLEQKGLVERTPDKSDRRVRMARLTKTGSEFLESMLPNYYVEIRRLFSGSNNSEKAALSELLANLRATIQGPVGDKKPFQRKKSK